MDGLINRTPITEVAGVGDGVRYCVVTVRTACEPPPYIIGWLFGWLVKSFCETMTFAFFPIGCCLFPHRHLHFTNTLYSIISLHKGKELRTASCN